MASKVNVKELGTVLLAGMAGAVATKLIKDNTKQFLKDDKMRNVVVPLGVIALAVMLVKNNKHKNALSAFIAAAGIYAAGGALDYMDRSKTKNDFLGLAGDDEFIEFGNINELQDYIQASLPISENYGRQRSLTDTGGIMNGDDDNLYGENEILEGDSSVVYDYP